MTARFDLRRALRIWARLATFALARLRYRRGLAVLAASGAALAVAMLTATLVLRAGVEDQAFQAALNARDDSTSTDILPNNAIYIDAPITENAIAIETFVSNRMRQDHLPFQASAIIVTKSQSFVVLGNELARNFVVDDGRLPRPCVRARCEYVESTQARPPPGFITAGANRSPLSIPGYHTVEVGRVHQKDTSVLPVPPGRVSIASGFALAGDRVVARGNGVLQWSAPLVAVVRHPWDVAKALGRTTRLQSDLSRRVDGLTIDSQSDRLNAARAEAATGGRRLLLVSGAMLGVFVAYMVFAATRLRSDADLLRERLSVANATRYQIRLLTFFEYLVSSVSGTIVGIVAGELAGALLVHRLGSSGPAAATRVLGLASTWVYWLAALAIAVGALVLVVSVHGLTLKGRSVALPETAGLIALATLVTGFTKGSLDSEQLAQANDSTIAFVVFVPVLVATVIAVALTRLFAPALALLGRLARRMQPTARLAALSIARRPGDAALVVGFVGAVFGLAIFIQIYRATLVRNQHDQVLYAAPADFLVSEDLRQLVTVNSIPLDRFPGQTKLPVLRAAGDVPQLEGSGAFTLLAVPAKNLSGLVGWRSDFSRLDLPELGRRLTPTFDPQFQAVPLPRTRAVLTLPLRSRGEAVDIAANLLSPTGGLIEVNVGDTHESTLRLRVPTGFRGGSLVGFVFRPGDTGLHQSANAGEFRDDVALGSLRIGPAPWIDFSRFSGVNGVDARADGHSISVRYAVGTNATGRLRVAQPTDNRLVPVIVSPQLARAAGARGVLPLQVLGTGVTTRVVGVARHFPTLLGNFILADQQTMATALNATDPGPPFYNEVWINDPQPTKVEATLAQPAMQRMTIVERAQLRDTARRSPTVRAARDLLALAMLVAVILGIAGIALAAVSDIRARRWELLDLSAQGIDRRGLARFLRLSLLLSSAFAVFVAVAVGIVLAFAITKLVRVTAVAQDPEPPLLVTVQWLPLVGAGLATAGVIAAVITMIARTRLRALEISRT